MGLHTTYLVIAQIQGKRVATPLELQQTLRAAHSFELLYEGALPRPLSCSKH